MDEEPKPKEATLTRPDANTQQDIMRTWQQIVQDRFCKFPATGGEVWA